MTAGPSIDPELFLHEQVAQASPDLLREMLTAFINTLLSAQAEAVCGGDYGTRSQDPLREWARNELLVWARPELRPAQESDPPTPRRSAAKHVELDKSGEPHRRSRVIDL